MTDESLFGRKKKNNYDDLISELVLSVTGETSPQKREADFEKLVCICEKSVYELALVITKNREDALDVSQETFIKLWQVLNDGSSAETVQSWYYYILRITRNRALDLLRSRSRRKTDSLSVTDEDGETKEIEVADDDISSDPVRSYEKKERAEAVRKAISSLDDDFREILVMRELQGLSYKEISDITGLEMGTVKSRIFRARMHIKEYLEKRNIL